MASHTKDNLIKDTKVDDSSSEMILLEPETKIIRHSKSRTAYTKFLIDEISEVVDNKKNDPKARANLQFYHIVRGGNVRIVKEVLEQLENNDKTAELSWLVVGNTHEKNRPNLLFRILQIVLFVLCLILFIVLSPVFYCVHAIVHNTHEFIRRRPIRSIELPLVFAVLSENKDMIKLFVNHGADITNTDRDGNNVYHYLADMSGDNAEKAIRCNEVLASCFDNIDELREVLMTPKNYLQLTAFEAIPKYGALSFFHNLMESRGNIGHRKLSISENSVWAKTPDQIFDLGTEDLTSSTDASTIGEENGDALPTVRIWEFDMGQFEKGDIFGKQSYLLHLITGRSVDQLPESDVTALYKSRIIAKWMQVKMHMYALFCVFAHVANVTISILLLVYLLLQGGDMLKFPLQSNFLESLLKHAANNDSLFDLFPLAMDDLTKQCKGQSQKAIQRMAFGDDETEEQIQDEIKLNHTIGHCLTCLIALQFFADLLVRLIFLCKNFNFKAMSLIESILPFICRWVPGSYAEKQLSVILFLPYMLALYLGNLFSTATTEINGHLMNFVITYTNESLRNETDQQISLAQEEMSKTSAILQSISVIFMVCLLLRFFHTIHAMRLLPGIGFFIITTKKMSRHLIQFGLVFGIVMLAFATMFHLCIRVPECPGIKAEGFDSLSTSLFSTYKASLGHGDFGHFSYNLNSEIAYIACTVVIIIMLLNLIIAVMTTTATDMNVTPWKQVLCLVELWDEILGVEAQVLALTQLPRYVRKKCQKYGSKFARWSFKKKRDVFVVVYHDKD